jgi:TusE/DsrC/DsvC family sulfur relay protein
VNIESDAAERIGGFLKLRSEWSESVASQIAEKEGIVLDRQHWDVIHFVRTEYYANHGSVPLERDIKRGMEKEWDAPVSYSSLYQMFPGGSLQCAKIAGCITITTVDDLLGIKGDSVWSIEPQQPVIDALSLLAEKNIGALMVVEEDRLVGVVSERDFTRDVLLKGRSPSATAVKEIMTENIISVAPDDSLEECMSRMVDRRFRHLPVLNENRLVGVLSMPDIVKVIVEQQQFTISRLSD